MLGLGIGELLVIAVVVLVVIPPSQIPKFMRTAGQYYGQIRRMAEEMRRSLVLEADRQDAEERYQKMMERRRKAEADREAAAAANPGVTAQAHPFETPDPPSSGTAEGASSVMAPFPAEDDDFHRLVDDPNGPYASGRTLADLVPHDAPIPGFSPEEWAELPPKVRAALRGRPSGDAA
jgi:sec-independent protein translocase protein TatB